MINPKDEYKFAGRMKLIRVPNSLERRVLVDEKTKARTCAIAKITVVKTALKSTRSDRDRRILNAVNGLLKDFDRAKNAEQAICNYDEHYRFKRMARLGELKRW